MFHLLLAVPVVSLSTKWLSLKFSCMWNLKKEKSWPVLEILGFCFFKWSILENLAYYSFPNKIRGNKLLNVDNTVKMLCVETRIALISSRVPHVILGEILDSWLFASLEKFVSICKSLQSLAKHCKDNVDGMWPFLLGEIIVAEPQVSGLFFVFWWWDTVPVVYTLECCKVEWKLFFFFSLTILKLDQWSQLPNFVQSN